MLATVKQRNKNKIKNISEFNADILLAEMRLKNSDAMKNRVPFEKVLEKFNITKKDIDDAEEVEFTRAS